VGLCSLGSRHHPFRRRVYPWVNGRSFFCGTSSGGNLGTVLTGRSLSYTFDLESGIMHKVLPTALTEGSLFWALHWHLAHILPRIAHTNANVRVNWSTVYTYNYTRTELQFVLLSPSAPFRAHSIKQVEATLDFLEER
jgi:hypothetical protein